VVWMTAPTRSSLDVSQRTRGTFVCLPNVAARLLASLSPS
jgi:hypothetical protein